MIALVLLAIYTLTVSLSYAVLWRISPDAANSSLVFFVALLLVPACAHDLQKAWKQRGRR